MREEKKPATREIVTRAIPFSFDENIPPIWNSSWPEWSHICNGISLTMPYMEPFLIRAIRGGLKTATSETIRQDIHGFATQEGYHFRNHRRPQLVSQQFVRGPLATVDRRLDARL